MRRLEKLDLEIQSVAAWVLRGGVITSVAVMLFGMVLSFSRDTPSIAEMQSRRFNGDLGEILRRSAGGHPTAIIELGVVLLVLTPILRVATSLVLFAFEEHDWLYTGITTAVLAITLYSLLILR